MLVLFHLTVYFFPVLFEWKIDVKCNFTDTDNAEEELNSVEVHTSLGASSASEISLGGQAKGDRLQLPQEEETLNESVRRLQISVQEYGPEQILVQKV